MRTLHDRLIGAALAGFRATKLHRGLAPLTRGRGLILAFHHVRPAVPRSFAPNAGLEITPDHLNAVLRHLGRAGYRIVPLDDVPERLAARRSERFAALTFDDGYRDTLVHALPVLERHAAPFTTFVTTGFADRTARLWWLELEARIAQATTLCLRINGRKSTFATGRPTEKYRAFATLARHLRASPPAVVAAALDELGCSPVEGARLLEALCLDWDGIARLGTHPLATIGCHTMTHPCLRVLDPARLRAELANACTETERFTRVPVRHLAYPYGGPNAAGDREFALAAELGFATAVTTRPGVLHGRAVSRLTALPRVSVNGLWPSLDVFDILLSGAPFAIRDMARRLDPRASSRP